ncbi:dTDP-4-dehydrorhamnose reductase [uncultured Bradyrhizobium sp.]|uniref:dTDP-4-dehydrorhamnose reductase n=1 Tax=uncultured Bradyrhizobium sp. TaxID=199684 RepID=UPI0035CC1C31
MRLFVIGAEGQVARSLREVASRTNDIVFGFGARPDLDLLRPASIAQALAGFRPDLVVNPAAYTAVDKAESEPDQAFAINRDGARAVASAAADRGVPVIHLSTDYVFDGKKKAPYSETDPVEPQGVYGRSKLEGERAVAEANPRHIVLRTSWVYAPFGSNFVRTMLRLSAERDRLRVVDDQSGYPTYAPDIAGAIVTIARLWAASDWHAKYSGVTHVAGPDVRTWCGFAREIVAGAAARGGRLIPVDPISTSDYPTPATRPANSCLSSERLEAIFGLRLPPLKSSLADCLDRLLH